MVYFIIKFCFCKGKIVRIPILVIVHKFDLPILCTLNKSKF